MGKLDDAKAFCEQALVRAKDLEIEEVGFCWSNFPASYLVLFLLLQFGIAQLKTKSGRQNKKLLLWLTLLTLLGLQ